MYIFYPLCLSVSHGVSIATQTVFAIHKHIECCCTLLPCTHHSIIPNPIDPPSSAPSSCTIKPHHGLTSPRRPRRHQLHTSPHRSPGRNLQRHARHSTDAERLRARRAALGKPAHGADRLGTRQRRLHAADASRAGDEPAAEPDPRRRGRRGAKRLAAGDEQIPAAKRVRDELRQRGQRQRAGGADPVPGAHVRDRVRGGVGDLREHGGGIHQRGAVHGRAGGAAGARQSARAGRIAAGALVYCARVRAAVPRRGGGVLPDGPWHGPQSRAQQCLLRQSGQPDHHARRLPWQLWRRRHGRPTHGHGAGLEPPPLVNVLLHPARHRPAQPRLRPLGLPHLRTRPPPTPRTSPLFPVLLLLPP